MVKQGFIPSMTTLNFHCYHCNSALLPENSFSEVLGGQLRNFCCAGCLAIAKTIHGEGLDMFYTRRIQANEKPASNVVNDTIPSKLLPYDDPSLFGRFTRPTEDLNYAETTLKLEKIRCAACVWLCEQHLQRLTGVKSIQINYVTQKVRIVFSPDKTSLSRLLFEIERIGYEAWPFEPSIAFEKSKKERRKLLTRLGVALLGMMQVMMYAWPTYVGSGDLTPDFDLLLSWTSWLLTVPVIVFSAAPIFQSAWHSVRQLTTTRQLNMDVPIALALSLTFLTGTINTLFRSGPSYFDSITMFVAFILLARYVELLARQDAQSGAEALAKQIPATCEKLMNFPDSEEVQIIPVVNCRLNDMIRVSPGDLIPVDAEVVGSSSEVDESLLTGEAKPILKEPGHEVFAGSHNIVNPLFLRVKAVGQSTRIAGIASLLDQALSAKPTLLSKTETWAGYFVTFLMLSAFSSAMFWYFIDASRAWTVLVAVLVASCPCALSLAIPTALAAAQGTATKLGLLIVRGHVMETLTKVSDLVIDKTGTITLGQPQLIEITHLRNGISADQALSIAAAMEMGQKHPLAISLTGYAREKNLSIEVLNEPVTHQLGSGLRCGIYRLGSASYAGVDPGTIHGQYGQVHLSDDIGLIASFIFRDEVRPGLSDLLNIAKKKNIVVHLVSGDHVPTVSWWANHVGITHFQGSCSPEEKYHYVKNLQQRGHRVLAIGDGINDAPLLAIADISIAVGSGAPLANAGADAILTTRSLAPLSKIVLLANKTQMIIKMNLIWAFLYNLVIIPFAMMGWVNPWIAGIGMSASSLLVTLNAWRLRKV